MWSTALFRTQVKRDVGNNHRTTKNSCCNIWFWQSAPLSRPKSRSDSGTVIPESRSAARSHELFYTGCTAWFTQSILCLLKFRSWLWIFIRMCMKSNINSWLTCLKPFLCTDINWIQSTMEHLGSSLISKLHLITVLCTLGLDGHLCPPLDFHTDVCCYHAAILGILPT